MKASLSTTRGMASASRPITRVVHTKANMSKVSFMVKAPTLGMMELTTRVSSSKIKAAVSENKHFPRAYTGATLKTTGPMELELKSTFLEISTRDSGKMECFTASAQCT